MPNARPSPSAGLDEAHAAEQAAARASAPEYDAAYESVFWTSERRSFAMRVARHARNHGLDLGAARVLDVGTGTGSLLGELRAVGARRLVGVDLSVDMLAIAAEKFPYVEFHSGPVERMPFPPASFDLVVGFSVLHHLPDLAVFFSWLAQVLRPGGIFAFSDPNAGSLLTRRARWLVWAAIYPVDKPLRIWNRATLEGRPTMENERYYSTYHRALTRNELLSALSPALEAQVSSHGLFAPSLNNAVADRRFDRAVLSAARWVDRLLPVAGDALVVLGVHQGDPAAESKRRATSG